MAPTQKVFHCGSFCCIARETACFNDLFRAILALTFCTHLAPVLAWLLCNSCINLLGRQSMLDVKNGCDAAYQYLISEP
jgi:hypothetical protein